ncbi:MAG TPA: TerB N-terminal domain-containing protein [Thermoanaerobaculia bacterium]|nr:TerB N-terminal domain-containing protein [Thermoanaerobaculia bacterium]
MSDSSSTVSRDYRWFSPGEPLLVGGRTINCGFLYAGTGGGEPSLVDLRQPVSEAGQYPRERCFGGESYASLASSYRGAYLDWLARGRVGRIFQQGLFFFLMGAERWLEDGVASEEELLHLSDECRRLAEVYAEFDVFAGRAADLADAIRLWIERTPPSHVAVDFQRTSQLRTIIGLREIAAARLPLPWDWALLLGADHPHGRFISKLLAHDEFRELFAIRYAQRFGEGIGLLGGDSTPHALHVQNPTLVGRLYPLPFLPQAAVPHASEEASAVVQLANRVEEELRPYLVKKRQSAPINVGLLPEGLVDRFGRDETEQLVARIDDGLAQSAFLQLSWAEILKYWRSPELQYGIPQRLSRVLARRGFGFEPHPTYPPRPWLTERSAVILFRESDFGDTRRQLQSAIAVVDAVVPVIRAVSVTRQPLLEYLARAAGLTEPEAVRLQARALWHVTHGSNPTYERCVLFQDLPLVEWLRDAWLTLRFEGRSLVDLVSDAVYSHHRPVLSRYGIGLPPRLFGSSSGNLPPAPRKKTPVPAVAVPQPSFQLDESAVATKLEESKRAAAFVDALGVDQEDESVSPQIRLSQSDHAVLRELVSVRPSSRLQLDTLCRTKSIFTLAFVERINDVAITVTGEPAVHVDVEVELDLHTLTTILEMEPTA